MDSLPSQPSVGPPSARPPSAGPHSAGAHPPDRPKNCFFSSPTAIVILSSVSWASFRGILVVFLKARTPRARLGSRASENSKGARSHQMSMLGKLRVLGSLRTKSTPSSYEVGSVASSPTATFLCSLKDGDQSELVVRKNPEMMAGQRNRGQRPRLRPC